MNKILWQALNIEELKANVEAVRRLLILDRTETFYNAHPSGWETDGRWSHNQYRPPNKGIKKYLFDNIIFKI